MDLLTKSLSKLISHAFNASRDDERIRAEDVRAIQKALKIPESSPSSLDTDALYVAVTIFAFGEALSRYWIPKDTDHLLPGAIRKSLNRFATTHTNLKPTLPDEKTTSLLQQASNNPNHNPYYRGLWEAFVSEPLDERLKSSVKLDAITHSPREFERHFRLAYAKAMMTPLGQALQLQISQERTVSARHIFADDMAAWGQRHILGNLQILDHTNPMPFIPLDSLYVEPHGICDKKREPLLALTLEQLDNNPLVLVTANFGHGKSLTARVIASRFAHSFISDSGLFPVFVDCARDIRAVPYNHEETIRRALWNHSRDALGNLYPMADEIFSPPSLDQPSLFIFDGLDSIAFTAEHLNDFFRNLAEHLGPEHRALVFTRPSALVSMPPVRHTSHITIAPFSSSNIAHWLGLWKCLFPSQQITIESLHERDLLDVARIPLLLWMIAYTWESYSSIDTKTTKTSLYENLMHRAATAKLKKNTAHTGITNSSRLLAQRLVQASIIEEADPIEATLWLMARTAWEDHILSYSPIPKDLKLRDVEQSLEGELDIDGVDLNAILMGLFFDTQIDPTGASKTILFGHQVFREYLVARYWKQLLGRLIDGRNRWHRSEQLQLEQSLMRGRLLQESDQAFRLLVEMLNDIDDDKRRELSSWAIACVEDDSLSARSLREDRRSILRENALAIGSALGGLQIGQLTLRSMWVWFEFHGLHFRVWAPKLIHRQANLRGVDLTSALLDMADLEGSDLGGANLRGADLSGANLRDTDLGGANLTGAKLLRANFQNADLSGSDLRSANLSGALLVGADLTGANLSRAILSDASLSGANLSGALLTDADLRRADLSSADLSGANLNGATLDGAQLHRTDFTGAKYVFAFDEQIPPEERAAFWAAMKRKAARDGHTLAIPVSIDKEPEAILMSVGKEPES